MVEASRCKDDMEEILHRHPVDLGVAGPWDKAVHLAPDENQTEIETLLSFVLIIWECILPVIQQKKQKKV